MRTLIVPQEAILTTLRLGGDTDTNACIVGYMVGWCRALGGGLTLYGWLVLLLGLVPAPSGQH